MTGVGTMRIRARLREIDARRRQVLAEDRELERYQVALWKLLDIEERRHGMEDGTAEGTT